MFKYGRREKLSLRRIEVVPYNIHWKEQYQKEASSLREVLGEQLAGIYHIGSTSIPTVWAKPIIDILIEANSLEEVDKLNKKFKRLGYEPRGEFGIPNRRYFPKGGDERTHHVHIFPKGHKEVTRHLAFRDYLIVHPEEAQVYAELKKKLAVEYEYSPSDYSNGKNALIQELEEKAKRWYIK
jgi:GrpB-like predicted nucleotidyltransferase (UPF0157 family)